MKVMKPIASSAIPTGHEWLYEVKYDGFRCVLDWDEHGIKLTSKNNKELTNQFPEIINFCLEKQDKLSRWLPLRLDGEVVVLNTSYQANFPEIQRRGRLKSDTNIKLAANKRPATFMAFDILSVNEETLEKDEYQTRKKKLGRVINDLNEEEGNRRIQSVNAHESPEDLWKVVFDYKAEGLIAKRGKSTYQSGKSHHDWFKVKNWRRIYGVLHRYDTKNGYFSVAVSDHGGWRPIGKCKHGLDDESLKTLTQLFLTKGDKKGNEYHLPPAIVAVIHTLDLYDGELREPEFAHLAVDIPAKDCTLEKLHLDLAMLPHDVNLSNLDKLFWPVQGMTKGDLVIYLREVTPYILPFMHQRALTLIRCPDGVDKEHFFQKQLPAYAPEFIDYSTTEQSEKRIVCENIESLIWFANHGAIEYHLPFQTVYNDQPIEIVFDLDPPSRKRFDYAIEAALLIKKILDDLGLVSFVKTSGNKGLQIHIPLPESSMTYRETALFIRVVAWTVERMAPDKFTTERLKTKRGGRLYIDYVQHGKDKTLIAPYSPRITDDATIATPLYWNEVTHGLRPEPFTMDKVVERLREMGCPFMNYFNIGELQQLDKLKRLIEG